jgi:hypothetical protein
MISSKPSQIERAFGVFHGSLLYLFRGTSNPGYLGRYAAEGSGDCLNQHRIGAHFPETTALPPVKTRAFPPNGRPSHCSFQASFCSTGQQSARLAWFRLLVGSTPSSIRKTHKGAIDLEQPNRAMGASKIPHLGLE